MRVHLLYILLLIGLLPLYTGLQIMRTVHWNQSYEKRLDLLVEQGEVLASQVAKNDYLFQQLQPEVTARIQSVADLVGGRVALVNNSLVVVKDTSGRESTEMDAP